MAVMCSICEKIFSKRSNLNRHKRNVHGVKTRQFITYAVDVSLFKCTECKVAFQFLNDLRFHLTQCHNFNNQVDNLSFSSYEEFCSWLKNEEKEEEVQYFKSTGEKKKAGFTTLYYHCRRSGKESNNAKGIRSRKSQGTCKLNQYCTSEIKIRKNLSDGTCTVQYFKSHYGHNKTIQHIDVPEVDRENIASQLVLGVSNLNVLESTRNKIGDTFQRKDLVNSQDIYNVKNSYNISVKEGCYHKNDATSVYIWALECKKSPNNPILFYKPQGEPSSDYNIETNDFCLIMMNEAQCKLLQVFGIDIVCMDSTHSLNSYDFEMTTILVIDEFDQGIPAAFMFTNKKNTAIHELFIMKVKERTGTICPRIFMSDITNVYINAWSTVMGSPKKHLYCSWHVDHAWQTNLSKVKDLDKRKWVYKSLKFLQTTIDKKEFVDNFHPFLQLLFEEESTRAMGDYINNYYSNNALKWAYCYRIKSRINTNNHLESMHKRLKYLLDGKRVKRLDKTLNALQKFVRNQLIDRIAKLTKDKITKHLSLIKNGHRKALTLGNNIELLKETENTYTIREDGNNNHCIVFNPERKLCCEIKCNICNICIHMVECTCLDYNIKTTICHHIHFACLKNNVYFKNEDAIKTDISKENEVNNIVQQLGAVQTIDLRSQIEDMALQVISNVQKFNHTDEEQMLILKNLKIAALLSATTLATPPDFKETLSSVNEMSTTQAIEKQTFFLRKNLKSKLRKKNSKPSDAKVKVIKEFLSKSLCVVNNSNNDHSYI